MTQDTQADDTARAPGVRVTKRPALRAPSTGAPEVVTKDMTVNAIISAHPQATEILAQYGLHCFGCAANDMESLEEGCIGHGFDSEDIRNLVQDINETIAATPPRPQTLTVTDAAARALAAIAEKEGKKEHGLAVIADEHGGFCLEFRKEPDRGDKIFTSASVSSIRVFASPLTLQRIGGATIDFREERFKLDIDHGKTGCACDGKSCGCKA